MRVDRITVRCAGIAVALLSAAGAHAENSPLGVWIDHTGRGAVEISECEGKLCGRVAWVKDSENSGECGKKIIGNVAPVGKNTWDNGWIYDPDRGKRFDVELTALDGDKLRVKGYAGTKWLSETHTWKRAPQDLKTCSTNAATEAATPAPANPDVAKSDDAKPGDEKAVPGLNAAKPDAHDGASTSNAEAKAPVANDKGAEAKTATADGYEDAPKASGGKGKVVARIMEELGGEDGPVKLKRSGKTCKVTAPYVGVISFPCDGE